MPFVLCQWNILAVLSVSVNDFLKLVIEPQSTECRYSLFSYEVSFPPCLIFLRPPGGCNIPRRLQLRLFISAVNSDHPRGMSRLEMEWNMLAVCPVLSSFNNLQKHQKATSVLVPNIILLFVYAPRVFPFKFPPPFRGHIPVGWV